MADSLGRTVGLHRAWLTFLRQAEENDVPLCERGGALHEFCVMGSKVRAGPRIIVGRVQRRVGDGSLMLALWFCDAN